MELATVKIKLGNDGDYTIINEADFDPEKHVLYDAPSVVAGDIPDDFPGAARLKKAGVTHLAQLEGKSVVDLCAATGVSANIAKAIFAKLQVLSAVEN